MYKIIPLTLKERVEIPVGSVVELELNEEVEVPSSGGISFDWETGEIVATSEGNNNYATIHIRKSIAKKGVLQCITTPLHESYKGFPTVVVQNNHVAPIELLQGEEVASAWVFTQ